MIAGSHAGGLEAARWPLNSWRHDGVLRDAWPQRQREFPGASRSQPPAVPTPRRGDRALVVASREPAALDRHGDGIQQQLIANPGCSDP